MFLPNPYYQLSLFLERQGSKDKFHETAKELCRTLERQLEEWLEIKEILNSTSIQRWSRGREGTLDWRHLIVCAQIARTFLSKKDTPIDLVNDFVDSIVNEFDSSMMGVWDTFRLKSALNTGAPEGIIRHSYTLFFPFDKRPVTSHKFLVRAFGADQVWIGDATTQGSLETKLLKFTTVDKGADQTDLNTTMGYIAGGVFKGVFLGTAPHKQQTNKARVPIVASRTIMIRNPSRTREMFLDHLNWINVTEGNRRREIAISDFVDNKTDEYGGLTCKRIHDELLGPNDFGGPRLYVV